MTGRIIFLNGTSSAGKSTLAKALQQELQHPFCYYASDQLANAGFRTVYKQDQNIDSPSERARFFDGFHRSIAAFAAAGNDLIVEHIVEEQVWAEDINRLLHSFDVFWVGVHAPLQELERREQQRGDRTSGEARYHLKTHQYCKYDFEIDSTLPVSDAVEQIISAWNNRALAQAKLARKSKSAKPSSALRGTGNKKYTTEQIMRMTRGDDWNKS
jgi:chloramphenicol 3-O phosphotransferase